MMLKTFVQDQGASQSPGPLPPGQQGCFGARGHAVRDLGPEWQQMWQLHHLQAFGLRAEMLWEVTCHLSLEPFTAASAQILTPPSGPDRSATAQAESFVSKPLQNNSGRMDIAIKHIRELFRFFKEFRISSSENCNIAKQIEIKFKDHGIPQKTTLFSKEASVEPIINEEDNFKMNVSFLIENAMIDCINRHSELQTKQEGTFSFLSNLHTPQKMSEETLKCHRTNLHLKLILHKTDFRKKVLHENQLQMY